MIIKLNYVFSYSNLLYSKMNRIKEVLEDQGRSQRWLADKLGKSYNMVNAYVQNRQQPRLEVLNQVAELLDVDIRDLIVSNRD